MRFLSNHHFDRLHMQVQHNGKIPHNVKSACKRKQGATTRNENMMTSPKHKICLKFERYQNDVTHSSFSMVHIGKKLTSEKSHKAQFANILLADIIYF